MVEPPRRSRTSTPSSTRVKRTYNVDENRVVLSGVSDGGTGAYYVAMRDTTPFASFLPLNGFIMVLRNDRLGVDGELFPNNLAEQTVLHRQRRTGSAVSDRHVEPFVDHLRTSGVTVEYHPQPRPGTTRPGGRR